MDARSEKRTIIRFLNGKISKNVDPFCIYQWIDRCYFQGWWGLGARLASSILPNTLPIEYHKRISYLLSVCLKKSEELKKIYEETKELLPTVLYYFWERLLSKAKKNEGFFCRAQITTSPWLGENIGDKRSGFYCNITEHMAWIELIIDEGPNSQEKNKIIFKELISHKDEIEKAFGNSLGWELLKNKRHSVIKKNLETGGLDDDGDIDELQIEMINAMCRFEKAVTPYLKQKSTINIE